MPKTVVKLDDAYTEKASLLEMPFHELPFFKEFRVNSFPARIQRYLVFPVRVKVRDQLHRHMQKMHGEKPFYVIDAIKQGLDQSFGSEFHYNFLSWNSEDTTFRDAWRYFYYHKFQVWLEENGFLGGNEVENWPADFAGPYHLHKYGQTLLTDLEFDKKMIGAVTHEALCDHNVTTLAQLAALGPKELYQYMTKSGYYNLDEQLAFVRSFLGQYGLKIQTVLET